MRQTIGAVLAAARKRVGLRQVDLAAQLEIDQTAVSAREVGRSDPPASEVERFVAVTGLPLAVTAAGWQLYEPPAVELRFLGKVPCGLPILFDYPEAEAVDLADLTGGAWRPERMFLLQAEGDSMEGAGIRDGDWLVIDHGRRAQLRDIVVATLNGSTTVKILGVDAETDDPVLVPASAKYDARQVTEFDELAVQGVVVGRMRYTPLG